MKAIALSILYTAGTLFLLPIAMFVAIRGMILLFVLIGDVGFTALLISIVFGLFFRKFKRRR